MEPSELKQIYTMPEVLRQYGISQNRYGFINCLSHTDKNASCKVYDSRLKCFSCNWTADILDLCGHIHNERDFTAVIRQFHHDMHIPYDEKPQRHRANHREEKEKKQRANFAQWKCRLEQQRLSEYRKQIYRNVESKQDEWVRACKQNRYVSDWIHENWDIKREIEEWTLQQMQKDSTGR